MTSVYDEVEIEDMEFVEDEGTFYYACPCGDRFQITLGDLTDGEEIAYCPSCTLCIRVIYAQDDLERWKRQIPCTTPHGEVFVC